MSDIGHTYSKTIPTYGCASISPLGFNINFKEHHGTNGAYAVTWHFDVPHFNRETVDLKKIQYNLENTAINTGSERSSLLKELVSIASGCSAKHQERRVAILQKLQKLESEISAYAYTNFALEEYLDDEDEDEIPTAKEVIKELFKNYFENKDLSLKYFDRGDVQVSALSDKIYTFGWNTESETINCIYPYDFGEKYAYFSHIEREYFNDRCTLLEHLARKNLCEDNPSSQASQRQDDLLLRNINLLEGAGQLCRYAQHIALKRHIETVVPLEKRRLEWKPSNKEMIKFITEMRGIKYLMHFTQAVNVESIIKNGLVSRTKIDKGTIKGAVNDITRWDKCLNHISVSISFPNDYTFKGMRNRHTDKDANWAVIRLDSSLLWDKDCVFNYFNAAQSLMSGLPISTRQQYVLYEKMFENTWAAEEDLIASCPTDVQAEVLVPEEIEVKYIKDILLMKKDSQLENIEGSAVKVIAEHDAFFGDRSVFLDRGGHDRIDNPL